MSLYTLKHTRMSIFFLSCAIFSQRALCMAKVWMSYVTFYRKRSTYQNVWRQISGTKCTWTLTSNVLKGTPFHMERHIFVKLSTYWNLSYGCYKIFTCEKSLHVDVQLRLCTWISNVKRVLKNLTVSFVFHCLSQDAMNNSKNNISLSRQFILAIKLLVSNNVKFVPRYGFDLIDIIGIIKVGNFPTPRPAISNFTAKRFFTDPSEYFSEAIDERSSGMMRDVVYNKPVLIHSGYIFSNSSPF